MGAVFSAGGRTYTNPNPVIVEQPKALNGAEMGRMVPRLCGYLTETRQLPIQPIGQHKFTSDAVGFENAEARQVTWKMRLENEIESAID